MDCTKQRTVIKCIIGQITNYKWYTNVLFYLYYKCILLIKYSNYIFVMFHNSNICFIYLFWFVKFDRFYEH